MTAKTRYFSYLLKCSDGSYYAGSTTDLKKRMRQHNGEIMGGAKYTRSRRPVLLEYYEEHTSLKSAIQSENALKRLNHSEKQRICVSYKE